MPVLLVQGAVPGPNSHRCVSLDVSNSICNGCTCWTTDPLVPSHGNCIYAASGVVQWHMLLAELAIQNSEVTMRQALACCWFAC